MSMHRRPKLHELQNPIDHRRNRSANSSSFWLSQSMPSFSRLFSNVKQKGKTTPKTRQNPRDDIIDASVAGFPRPPNPNAPWRKRSASSHGDGSLVAALKVWSLPSSSYSTLISYSQAATLEGKTWRKTTQRQRAMNIKSVIRPRQELTQRRPRPASQLGNYGMSH